MKLRRFYIPHTYPTPKQMKQMVEEFSSHFERGLHLDEIAYRMEVTRGTVCVLRRLHIHGGLQ